ncbi:hypothetical protein ACU609_07125 [Klebsiella aerogenes]|nr:hypothetical protein [Klebsiella aerogenes]HDT3336545.1 hypothetical protein [Klebsiella aerogenes]HDU4035049.1 hypothetical protein [Klebsiella aerogenes]HDU5673429.1 hypothetical protein [Klebsiella aerogenes]
MKPTALRIAVIASTLSLTAPTLAAHLPLLSSDDAQTYCEIQYTAMKKSWEPTTNINLLVEEAVRDQQHRGVPFQNVGVTETEYRENLRTALTSMRQHHSAFGNNRQTFVTNMDQQEKACVQQLSQPGNG